MREEERALLQPAVAEGARERRDLRVQRRVHVLRALPEGVVLRERQRRDRAEAAAGEDDRRLHELVDYGRGGEPEGHGRVVARVVGAAVVDADRIHALQAARGHDRHQVRDPGCAAHAQHGQQARAAELRVERQLPPRHVEEPAQVDVVAARVERRPHHVEVQGVGRAVHQHADVRQLPREPLAVARVGRLRRGAAAPVSAYDAPGRRQVAVESQHAPPVARQAEDGRASHGARGAQHGHGAATGG